MTGLHEGLEAGQGLRDPPLMLQHPGAHLVHPGEEAQVLLPGKNRLGLVQVPQRLGRFAHGIQRGGHDDVPVAQGDAVRPLPLMQQGGGLFQLGHGLRRLALPEQYGGQLYPAPGQHTVLPLRLIVALGLHHQGQRLVVLCRVHIEQPLLGVDIHQPLLIPQRPVVVLQLLEIALGPLEESHPAIGIGDPGQHLAPLALQPQGLVTAMGIDKLHQPLGQLPLVGVHLPPQVEDVGPLPLIPQPARQGQGRVVVLPRLVHVAEQLLMITATGEQAALGDPVLAAPHLSQRLVGKLHGAQELLVPLARLGPALQPGDAPLHLGRVVIDMGNQGGDTVAKHLQGRGIILQLLQLQGQRGLGQPGGHSEGGCHSQPYQQANARQDLHADSVSPFDGPDAVPTAPIISLLVMGAQPRHALPCQRSLPLSHSLQKESLHRL